MAEPTADELLSRAYDLYEEALELLSKKDYYDAAEKAWGSVELVRKAFLVALKIPYEKAKTTRYGLTLFSDILRHLGRRDLLKAYDRLMLRLHILGFYEQISSPDEIDEIIRDELPKFLDNMKELIDKAKNMDARHAAVLLDKINSIKRELLAKSAELYQMRKEYINYIESITTEK